MNRLKQLFARENRLLWFAGGGAFCLAAIAGALAGLAGSMLEANTPLLEIGGAEGTVWRGEFADVSYNSLALGRISYKLHPAQILIGRLAVEATSADGALVGRGGITLTQAGFEAKKISAQFNLAAIRNYTFFGAPYQGVATLTAQSLELSRNGCKAVDARVSTTMLDGVVRSWAGGSLPLNGGLDCKDGKLMLALSGRNTDGVVRVEAAIAPDLSYTMTVAAEPIRDEVGVALRHLGFEGDNAQLSLRAAGQLKGLTS